MRHEPDETPVKYGTRERIAGALVILALLLLASALAFSSQIGFLLADTFTLHAEIETAEGVDAEAPVKHAGIEIGKVTDVVFTPERRVMMTLAIREKYHDIVREDSVARVNRMALLGDVTVEITQGDPALPVLADGARIRVEEAPGIDELLTRLPPVIDDVVATARHARAVVEAVKPEIVAAMTRDLAAAVGDVRALTASLGTGKGLAGRLLHDEKLAADVARSIANLSDVLKQTEARLAELEPVLANAAARTEEMQALITGASELVTQITESVASFDSGQGDAVSGVLLEARSALDEAGKTLRTIRNTWPFSANAPEEQPVDAIPPQPPSN